MTKSKLLSAYEQLREDNIQRNQAFLSSLGLNDIKPVLRAKLARGRTRNDRSDDEIVEDQELGEGFDEVDQENKKRIQSRSKRFRDNEPQPSRRSSRHSEAAPELLQLDDSSERSVRQAKPLPSFSMEINVDDEDVGRKKVSANVLRELITSQNLEHSELISDESIVHCLYRITSMSNKALSTRVKMIARAQGKQSQEKLLVFYYGLRASGLDELAASCWEACKHNGALSEP